MRQIAFLLTFCAGVILSTPLLAQERAWVQIEAQPGLAQAEERARAYAQAFPDVAGFQMGSGWYAIVLGPYSPDDALARLAGLRAENLIPGDSFIAGGSAFRQPFWPPGRDPANEPMLGAALPEPIATVPLANPEEPVTGDPANTVQIPEPPVLPDETPAEARRSESQLSRAEREELQSALQWFGHYSAAIDGAFGPGTRASMTAWQMEKGYEESGILTTAQRAELLNDLARIRADLGLSTVTEAESGIEISLPLGLVEFDQYEPPFVHYREKADSGLRIALISQPGDQAALSGLYDILQTLRDVPPQGQRSLNERGFTIEAQDATVASYTRAELSQGLVKGYMLIWDPTDPEAARRAESATKVMQTSFRPIGGRALDPGLITLDDSARRGLLAGMEVRKPTLSRSGFYVSASGDVLTTTEVLQSCNRITLDHDTDAETIYSDAQTGFAVLRPVKPLAPRNFASFATKAPRIGQEIALAGYTYEAALPAPTLTYGTLEDLQGLEGEDNLNRLSLAPLPGDVGGPVIDGTGAVLGMLLPKATPSGRVLPEGTAFIADADNIASTLAGTIELTRIEQTGALAPEDLTNLATSMTVLVSCWK